MIPVTIARKRWQYSGYGIPLPQSKLRGMTMTLRTGNHEEGYNRTHSYLAPANMPLTGATVHRCIPVSGSEYTAANIPVGSLKRPVE